MICIYAKFTQFILTDFSLTLNKCRQHHLAYCWSVLFPTIKRTATATFADCVLFHAISKRIFMPFVYLASSSAVADLIRAKKVSLLHYDILRVEQSTDF